MKNTKFVPNDRGELFTPSELYDPSVHTLHDLLDDACFPAGRLTMASSLATLRQLGLRSEMTPAGLLSSVQSVVRDADEGNHAAAKTRAISLTRALRSMVHDEGSNKALNTVLNRMKNMQWMPIQQTSTCLFPLPWKADGSLSLAKPIDCRPKNDAWLCSASYFIVDDQVPIDLSASCPIVASCFGWTTALPMNVLARQLRDIASVHQARRRAKAIDALPMAKIAVQVSEDDNDKRNSSSNVNNIPIAVTSALEETKSDIDGSGSSGSGSGSGSGSSSDSTANQEQRQLVKNIFRLYESLSSLVLATVPSKEKETMLLSLRQYIQEDTPCIYVDHQFVEVRRCAFQAPPGLDARPHLYELPTEMKSSCRPLFEALSMKEEFGMLDLFQGLQTMYNKSKEGKRRGEDPHPLDRKQVEFAITIVNILAGGMARYEQRESEEGKEHNHQEVADSETKGQQGSASHGTTTTARVTTTTTTTTTTPAAQGTRIDSQDNGNWIALVKERMVVPDENFLLCPAKTMVYDDASWLSSSIQNRKSMHFVHTSISHSTAKRVGVRSLRRLLVANREGTTYRFPLDKTKLQTMIADYDYVSRLISGMSMFSLL